MNERFDLTPMPRSCGPRADISPFDAQAAQTVRSFHQSMKEYSVTPLVSLKQLAARMGVKGLYVKDESYRFGLNAFKALGGSYAMHLYEGAAGDKPVFATATDGNHGRGVAWAAARLGCEAHVFMPRGTVQERLENIRRLGAHAEITDMCYDDTVRYTAQLAAQHGWILLQDTSWPGYEEAPLRIMQGYITLGAEIAEQLGDVRPTHVFLQAGVGSMAAAVAAYFANRYGDDRPQVIVVEPNGADCIFRTAKAADEQLHCCGEDMHSIMAGLCCGEPCTIAWNILRDYADFALSCPDHVSADGMRILGNPLPGDTRIISGESGAVTTGAAAALMLDPALASQRAALRMDADSVILCISTEGDTDQENYRRIVWYGAYAGGKPSF